MRALLDTHVLLWWLTDSQRLSTAARELLADATSDLLWSAASTWEMGIKVALGKLSLPEPLTDFVARQMRAQGLTGLPIYHEHAARTSTLPPVHRDPFDRLLVGQALVERVPLVTRDTTLRGYGIDVVVA